MPAILGGTAPATPATTTKGEFQLSAELIKL